MNKPYIPIELVEQLIDFSEWFNEKYVSGAKGTETDLYKCMKRDYLEMLEYFEIKRKG